MIPVLHSHTQPQSFKSPPWSALTDEFYKILSTQSILTGNEQGEQHRHDRGLNYDLFNIYTFSYIGRKQK